MMNKLPRFFSFSVLCLATFVSVSPLHAASDTDFGRLFSTEHERDRLDQLRQNRVLQAARPQSAATPAPAAALPQSVTLQGYVKRSDGATTLWVNNQPVQENSALEQVEIGQLGRQKNSARSGSDSLNIRIPATGKNIRLKAGQVYAPESDQVLELKLLEKAKQLELEQTGTLGGVDAE